MCFYMRRISLRAMLWRCPAFIACFLAGRDDRCGRVSGDRLLAFAGVEGAVGCDAYDLLSGRDLVEKFGQPGHVAHIAGGELDRPNLKRLLVDPDLDALPESSFLASMAVGVPLSLAFDRDPGAVKHQVQEPSELRIGDCHLWGPQVLRQGAEVRHCRVQAD